LKVILYGRRVNAAARAGTKWAI